MQEYQCICCGETKQSEKLCTCPTCGYTMFPAPYDRKMLLNEQIRSCAEKLTLPPIEFKSLSFYRQENHTTVKKAKDDARFPTLQTIQNYVCSASKLEVYVQRLHTTVEQIKTHLHTPYQQSYSVDYTPAGQVLERWQQQWEKVAAELHLSGKLDELSFPNTSLTYSETPKRECMATVEELCEKLHLLTDKMKLFVKSNNIYSTDYHVGKDVPRKRITDSTIEDCIENVQTVLSRRYTVDLFSDGSDELKELGEALWISIAVLLQNSLLIPQWAFSVQDQHFDQQGLIDYLQEIVWCRYDKARAYIHTSEFLRGRSEEELFELYNRLIVLDDLGVMGLKPAKILEIGAAERQLQSMVGLDSIKTSIQKIKAYVAANKGSEKLNVHMCFYGNPGTGKTEVARIIARILHESKILPTDNVVEVDRGGLVGQYVGETSQKTMNAISSAMGGVLFVDEAYSLTNGVSAGDYGHEAVATLLKAMEDYRGEFCVILAGYKEQMKEMLSSNPGFRSRIQFELDFPNYERAELSEIAMQMAIKRGYSISDSAKERMLDIADIKRKEPNFANAREIRNILDQTIMCHELRVCREEDSELALVDVAQYIRDAKIYLPTSEHGRAEQLLTADEELERLIGLVSVKKTVRKIRAYAKRNIDNGSLNLHMCFCGNPGTGKTEVARLMSRLFYEAGVLPEAKMIETDASGLLGSAVGETAPKVHKKVQEALGGALFIDEAYALTVSNSAAGAALNYGAEAIAALLKEMEDRRGQFCVIFAGYQVQMEQMLSANPGLASRVPFTLHFSDFDKAELNDLLIYFLKKNGYEMENAASSRLLDCMEFLQHRPNYANARTLRNVLEQVIMNQNLRTEGTEDSLILLSDVEEYLSDENIAIGTTPTESRKIGFA